MNISNLVKENLFLLPGISQTVALSLRHRVARFFGMGGGAEILKNNKYCKSQFHCLQFITNLICNPQTYFCSKSVNPSPSNITVDRTTLPRMVRSPVPIWTGRSPILNPLWQSKMQSIGGQQRFRGLYTISVFWVRESSVFLRNASTHIPRYMAS